MIRLVLAAALLFPAAGAGGVEPDEVLADPALEARARAISRELRCLVCQNQSIDDSDAALARDLRVLVRERLAAGDDDARIRAFVADRYGDFVLLRPPFRAATYALWLGPAAILAAGAAAAGLWLRRRRASAGEEAALDAGERRRVARLMGGERGR